MFSFISFFYQSVIKVVNLEYNSSLYIHFSKIANKLKNKKNSFFIKVTSAAVIPLVHSYFRQY